MTEGFRFAPLVGANRAFFRLQSTADPNSELGRTDHDGDGIATADELDTGLNAVVPETIVDNDADGLPDYWEDWYFGDMNRDGTGDEDGDGLLDSHEWQHRTDPTFDDAAVSYAREEFQYDDRGWLEEHKPLGTHDAHTSYDATGNTTEQNIP